MDTRIAAPASKLKYPLRLQFTILPGRVATVDRVQFGKYAPLYSLASLLLFLCQLKNLTSLLAKQSIVKPETSKTRMCARG